MKKRKYNWSNHIFNFIAVILGVYLAFYINERAKINQDRNESLTLMNSLVGDLSEDIRRYEEYQIPVNIQHQQNVESLLESLLTDSLDHIGNQLSAILGVENYAPTSSTYNSMKSSGKLRLIEDLALQKMLTDYYDGLVIESDRSDRKGEYQVE
jgi:C4-dicarboxylate-specific signal transduction histidine kinase